MQIENVQALVTGAAGGIGSAICTMLLENGASKVGLLDKNLSELNKVGNVLSSQFGKSRITSLHADVMVPEQVEAVVTQFAKEATGLNLLVNNAGILLDGAIYSISPRGGIPYSLDHWRETLETNLGGTFIVTRSVLEQILLHQKNVNNSGISRGLIVTISSISRFGRAGQGAYSASKGGLVSLSVSLAQELMHYRIRSVVIAPGLINTSMAALIPEVYRKEMLNRTTIGRMGRPEEIAHGVKFCIENEFFNGRVLEIDGGAF